MKYLIVELTYDEAITLQALITARQISLTKYRGLERSRALDEIHAALRAGVNGKERDHAVVEILASQAKSKVKVPKKK